MNYALWISSQPWIERCYLNTGIQTTSTHSLFRTHSTPATKTYFAHGVPFQNSHILGLLWSTHMWEGTPILLPEKNIHECGHRKPPSVSTFRFSLNSETKIMFLSRGLQTKIQSDKTRVEPSLLLQGSTSCALLCSSSGTAGNLPESTGVSLLPIPAPCLALSYKWYFSHWYFCNLNSLSDSVSQRSQQSMKQGIPSFLCL